MLYLQFTYNGALELCRLGFKWNRNWLLNWQTRYQFRVSDMEQSVPVWRITTLHLSKTESRWRVYHRTIICIDACYLLSLRDVNIPLTVCTNIGQVMESIEIKTVTRSWVWCCTWIAVCTITCSLIMFSGEPKSLCRS